MKISITGHETAVTPEIKKYTETKLNKLCRKYKQIIAAEVVLETGTSKAKKEASVAKILLKIKGQDISASSSGKTLFAAVDDTERKLLRQLDKEKAKHDATSGKFARSKKLIRKFFSRDEQ